MAILQSTIARPLLLGTRTMQWVSSVIAMGIYAYFVHKQHHGTHIIFNLVISVLSVVFFLPAFLSPFKSTLLSKWVALIDMIFSYLWLTAFIFSSQSYNYGNVYFNAPFGVKVSVKHAAEAFTFLAFFFTVLGLLFETMTRWVDADHDPIVREKHHGDARAPLDAPANTTGAAAV
ncbi:conserved hypothetical protein [Talaromyces stipitatus ATCC 10500]|uniref:MARVEL domain-containing protein n=1 Tax=Talaromyces stipitatus (strain ATCC 10500 / CBS 375.48 / QM 6759 / NRRL 1006) TaxID=441959 RepID=B8MP70_TALSN|nr:uncharacterized protein TSTA_105210 [Talaromyces stipitatus ATCC 10500]EED14309.1 conserved hypothetical protein [Talaromyces stipitatus ATCC 10500]